MPGPILRRRLLSGGVPAPLAAFAGFPVSHGYVTTDQTDALFYQMMLNEVRALEAQKLVNGIYQSFPANTPLIAGGAGHDVYQSYTQYFLNDTAPVNQTITLPATGSYTLHVFGPGSAAVAAGTATISNAGSADASAPRTIGCTGTGTVSITITGSPARVWFTNTAFAVPPVTTAGSPVTRNASISTVTGQPALGDFRVKLRPNILDLTDRTFWSRGELYDEVRFSMVSGKIRQTITKTGAETLTNPGDPFTVTTGWVPPSSTTLSVVNGLLRAERTTGTDGAFFAQSFQATAGETYLFTFDCVDDGSSRAASIYIGTLSGLSDRFNGASVPGNSFGERTLLWTAPNTETLFVWFYPGSVGAANNYTLWRKLSRKQITTPVLIETSAYTEAPGIVEIEAIAADGNQSIDATGRTGATSAVAVSVPTGTPRFGRIGGNPAVAADWPNCTNMDYAMGPA
jgi:hypothetical protein